MTSGILLPENRFFLGLSPVGFHKVRYRDWCPDTQMPTVVAVHGLLRTSAAFESLAQYLCPLFRMVCPDIVGRGESDWLLNPAFYDYPQYLLDMVGLVARLGVEEVHWIGTSMGGLIGMLLAAQPGSFIKTLILNDIGPFVPQGALKRIVEYASVRQVFASFDQAQEYIQNIHGKVGAVDAEYWERMTHAMIKQGTEGGFVLRSDPMIAKNLQNYANEDLDFWELWERISCPVLVLHGVESDVLSFETSEKMKQRSKAPVQVVHLEGVGHAPGLVSEYEKLTIKNWLTELKSAAWL